MSGPEGIVPSISIRAVESIEIPKKSKYIAIKCNGNNQVISIRGFGKEADIAKAGYKRVSISTMDSFYSDLSKREIPDKVLLNCLKKIGEAVKVLNAEVIRLFKRNFPKKDETGDITVKKGMDLAQKIDDATKAETNPKLKEKKEKENLERAVKEGEYIRFKFLLNKSLEGNANPKQLLNDLLNEAVYKYEDNLTQQDIDNLTQQDIEKIRQPLKIIGELIKRGADGKAILDRAILLEDVILINIVYENAPNLLASMDVSTFIQLVKILDKESAQKLFKNIPATLKNLKIEVEAQEMPIKLHNLLEGEIFVRDIRNIISQGDDQFITFILENMKLFSKYPSSLLIEDPNKNTVFALTAKLCLWKPFKDMLVLLKRKTPGIFFDHPIDNRWPPLFHAAISNEKEIVCDLIKNGANPNTKDDDGNTLLHILAKTNRFDELKHYLLDQKDLHFDLDIQDSNGDSVLHLLANLGQRELLAKLITKYKPDLNIQNNKGKTILHLIVDQLLKSDYRYSVKIHDLQLISALIKDHGADPNVKDNNGNTILHLLVKNGLLRPDELAKFISKVDPNIQDQEGKTILDLAATLGWDLVEVMLNNIKVNEDLPYIDSIVSLAAKAGRWGLVGELIVKGGNPNLQDKDGNTILHLAVKAGNWNNVRALIEDYKADPNIPDKSGETVATYAAKAGQAIKISKTPSKKPPIKALAKRKRKPPPTEEAQTTVFKAEEVQTTVFKAEEAQTTVFKGPIVSPKE